MNAHEISQANSKKLDRVILALEGTEDSPGISGRLAKVERILFGKDESGGLVQQHIMLWRAHVWILCSLSGLIGAGLTEMVRRWISKGHP